MAKLTEYAAGVRAALTQFDQVSESYNVAKRLYENLSNDASVALQGLGLELRLASGESIPVPLPTDRQMLIELLEHALAFLGNEVLRCWDRASEYTEAAAAHCTEVRAAEAQAAAAPQIAAAAQPLSALPTASIPVAGS